MLSGLLVIEYPLPLFLLSDNVFWGGQKAPSWKFECIFLKTSPVTGTVSGSLRLKCKAEVEEVHLA